MGQSGGAAGAAERSGAIGGWRVPWWVKSPTLRLLDFIIENQIGIGFPQL